MKKFFKKLLAKYGYKISKINNKVKAAKKNVDAFETQKHLIKDFNSELIIFDVGAYVGGIALKYNELFPNCKIYCFEPFPDSFFKLEQKVSYFENIITINQGLSEKEGLSRFQINSSPDTNSLLKTDKESEMIWGKGLLETLGTVEVKLTTLDKFVETNSITQIDILKLDAQGAEFMILNGGKNTFEKGIVKIIYTEIIILPTYEGQIHFDETINLIRSFGFELFNFYNHSYTEQGQLRQVDAIFNKANYRIS